MKKFGSRDISKDHRDVTISSSGDSAQAARALPPQRLINSLNHDLGLRVCELPFRTVVEHALKENWGRDLFDRLIVANAKARGAGLVTKDERIRQHFPRAVW
jgi:PIN domain nuclease of toxin-antitoxin system